ncbi:hypothetical protein Y1Q_0022345 [Alligator mississippiensis]|uniref:Ig-like domain-containing protein n=1 Tax=Alligator mississippiensis TaxID=8496 RepID=A0A151NDP2_ALLMI|nr:hypothetical protein Y1Q_0022345 [Alligator mississippiensis]
MEDSNQHVTCSVRNLLLNQEKAAAIDIAGPTVWSKHGTLSNEHSPTGAALLGNSPGERHRAPLALERQTTQVWQESKAAITGHIAMERGVSSFPLGPIVSLSLPSCITLLVSLQIHQLMAAQFRVTGPAQPIIVSVGEAAVLPCCLSPRMNAEDMEVRWFRSWFSPYVHLYRHRRDQYAQQMPEYQRRTWLIKDDITSGSVFLIICSVRPSDHGQYKCSFQSGSSYEEALLDLQVTAMGSGPHISADGYQDGGIQVGCRSAGWYPEPKAHWRDHRGQLLPTTFEEISTDTDGLFHTEISIIIMEESNRKVTCCVRNPLLNQEKTATVDIAEMTEDWGCLTFGYPPETPDRSWHSKTGAQHITTL